MKKNIAAIMLALITLLTVFSACKTDNNGGSVNESGLSNIKISASLWDISDAFPQGAEMDKLGKEILGKFNITIEPVNVTWADATEKYNVWAASNTLPDIIGATDMVGSGLYHQWINEGLLRAVPTDLSAYPNVAKNLALSEVAAYQKDGKNYFMPRMTTNDPQEWSMERGLVYRKDWLDALGMDVPTTEQEFIDMCIAFATKDPDGNGKNDTIGLGTNGVWPIFSQSFPNYGYVDNFWVQDENGNYAKGNALEANVKLVDMLRRLNKAGGLDPDFITRKGGEIQDLFAAGLVGVYTQQVSPTHMLSLGNKFTPLNADKTFTDSVGILPYWDIEGVDKCESFIEKSYWSESYFAGTVDDEKMERIMMLYNYLYSEEGINLITYGYEGEDYEVVDGEIKPTFDNKEDGTKMAMKDKYPSVLFLGQIAAWTTGLSQYQDPNIDPAILEMCNTELEFRKNNYNFREIDWEVQSIDVPEKQEMTVNFNNEWGLTIVDISSKTTQELYLQNLSIWSTQGYKEACEAVTKAAKELAA